METNIHETCSVRRGLSAFSKSIETCKPACTVCIAQTDIGRKL